MKTLTEMKHISYHLHKYITEHQKALKQMPALETKITAGESSRALLEERIYKMLLEDLEQYLGQAPQNPENYRFTYPYLGTLYIIGFTEEGLSDERIYVTPDEVNTVVMNSGPTVLRPETRVNIQSYIDIDARLNRDRNLLGEYDKALPKMSLQAGNEELQEELIALDCPRQIIFHTGPGDNPGQYTWEIGNYREGTVYHAIHGSRITFSPKLDPGAEFLL